MGINLNTLAVQRIGELAEEAQSIINTDHADMGEYGRTDSAFGRLNDKIYQIKRWVEALDESL